jgi:hypothetical protein
MSEAEARDDYATDDASLCDALDDDLRETISKLAESRGQTSAGVVKAAITQLADDYEGRLIEFSHPEHARSYYKHHKRYEQEFAGAYEELTPDLPDYEYPNPAQPLHELLQQKKAEHAEKARAAARYLDSNDPNTRVLTNEYGAPEAVPQLDEGLEVQHPNGGDDE